MGGLVGGRPVLAGGYEGPGPTDPIPGGHGGQGRSADVSAAVYLTDVSAASAVNSGLKHSKEVQKIQQ